MSQGFSKPPSSSMVYETVGSEETKTIGQGVGDVLVRLVFPAGVSDGVTIKDGGTTIMSFPSTVSPSIFEFGAKSQNGAWSVEAGVGDSVVVVSVD